MNREHFIEGLREQYAEKIQRAYRDCLRQGRLLDFTMLTRSLEKMQKNAKVEGLPETEFRDLVEATVPEIQGKVNWAAASLGAQGRLKAA